MIRKNEQNRKNVFYILSKYSLLTRCYIWIEEFLEMRLGGCEKDNITRQFDILIYFAY